VSLVDDPGIVEHPMLAEQGRTTDSFPPSSTCATRLFMVKPRPRLDWYRVPKIAKELHAEMYTHFATGDLAPIESRVCAGLLSSLRRRIALRPQGTKFKWTLHRYLSEPKLSSYKAPILPGPKSQTARERSAIFQAVVRIHSLQSLQHYKQVPARDEKGRRTTKEVLVDSLGNEVQAGSEKAESMEKEAVEYVVVQKLLHKGRMSPWMLWGTAEETTPDRLLKMRKQERDLAEQNAAQYQ
jgi:mitochondrial protein MBA1